MFRTRWLSFFIYFPNGIGEKGPLVFSDVMSILSNLIQAIWHLVTHSTYSSIYLYPIRDTCGTQLARSLTYCAFAAFAFAALFASSFAIFSRRAMAASVPMPPNTRPTPRTCICVRRWPKATTESIIVNILRVTVTVTRRTEEKVDRV